MKLQMWILFACLTLQTPVAAAFNTSHAVSDTAQFALVKQNGGISLYERWYVGPTDIKAREVKAIFLVDIEPDAAVALIRDQRRGREWNKNTREYKVVELEGDKWISYMHYDLPWPLSDQDCVLEHSPYRHNNSIYIPFEAVPHVDFPESDRVQRIPNIRGKWVFSPDPAGTRVEYYITTTPSSSLPTWVTDPVIRNNLIASLQAFRDILQSKELTRK